MQGTKPPTTWLLTPSGITWASVIVNVALTGVKFAVGWLFGSQTLLADALHSGSDLATDIAVLAGLRVTNKPADTSHPYGHRRVSTLVGLFVGAALGAAGLWLVFQAIQTLHAVIDGRDVSPLRAGWPFWVALASVAPKEVLFRLTRWIGRASQDVSLIANAWHHRTDAFAALAAAVGLAGVILGGESWRFLDPLTAMVLAAFLLVAAYKISASAASELIDRAPTQAMLEAIERAVAGTPGVRSHHAFRARQLGGKVEMDIHVQVDPHLTVREGHDIAKAVRQRVRETDDSVVQVIVHVEPAE